MYLNDRWCSCYTCLPRTAPAAAQTDLKTDAAPGTDTGSPQMDQRLLTITWPKTVHNNKHTSKHKQKLRNSTSIRENSKQN